MIRTVKELTIDNLSELINLEKKFNPTYLTDNRAYINYFLNSEEPDYKFFGLFNDTTLTTAIGFINNPDLPAWTLNKFYFFDQTDALTLYKKVTEVQERKKLYQYFTCIEESELLKYKMLKDVRYATYLEHTVLPNQLTGYENIDHDVLNYVKRNATTLIHLRVLKNEYRTD
jgi:hypothetical protein